MTEEGSNIVIDFSDETGGLGLKVYMPPDDAIAFGQGIIARAKALKGDQG